MNCIRCDNKGFVKQYDPLVRRFVKITCPDCHGVCVKKPANG